MTLATFLEIFKLASMAHGMLKRLTDDRDRLDALIAEAHAKGLTITADQVKASVEEMHTAGDAARAFLAAELAKQG